MIATLLTASLILTAAPEKDDADLAIERALKYLRSTQLDDGSWPRSGLGPSPDKKAAATLARRGHPAVTALAVMAFLSAGKVPGEGADGLVVERGLRAILDRQKANGLIADPSDGAIEMYVHGICTLMLAESVGMTTGPLNNELRTKLIAAVRVILAAQRLSGPDIGGWRYRVVGTDADLSVTGWQVLALRAAKNAGCDVPAERIRLAVDYCRRCFDPSTSGFRYQPTGPVTAPCTGTGILAIELCGKEFHRCDEVLKGGQYLLNSPLYVSRPHFSYGVYYTAQGMFQLGGEFWKDYRPKLHELLLKTNTPQPDGSWQSRGGWDDDTYGPAYCTAMAVLALAVEYRFLPIYQRFEDPVEVEP